MKNYSTLIALGLLSFFLSATVAYSQSPAANPASGVTSNGQTLEIAIDTPAAGSTVIIPPGQVRVAGRTTMGRLSANTNILYVVDVSRSTEFFESHGQDCNGDEINGDSSDDFNGDNQKGNTLDCEISGVIALNESLAAMNIQGVEGGLVAFGSKAEAADMSPAPGEQPFVSILEPSGAGNLNEVARSLDTGVVQKFTPKDVGHTTQFSFALAAMNDAFAQQPADERNIAFFLSDGTDEFSTPSLLNQAIAAGTIINTFSVGNLAAGCGPVSTLRLFADATGGQCLEAPEPSDLAAILPTLNPAGLDRIEVRLNGGAPTTVLPNPLGNWSVDLAGLACGPNSIEATAVATDGTRVTAGIAVQGNCSPATSITILNQTAPAITHDFDFSGDLGDFTLTSNSSSNSQTFEVPAGDYVVTEQKDSLPDENWSLLSVACQDQNAPSFLSQPFFPPVTENETEFSATISVQTNQELTCVFLNQGANIERDYLLYLPSVSR